MSESYKDGQVRCSECDTMHDLGNGLLSTEKGKTCVMSNCPKCKRKAWSKPFKFPKRT